MEDFERFWEYKSRYWAGRFLDQWCDRAMRSHLEPMKKFVKLLHNHRDSLLNWFKSKDLSSGIVEGLNNKVKTTFKPSNATTDFEPKKHSKYRYITLLENYQNQNLPINFGEETFLCCIVY